VHVLDFPASDDREHIRRLVHRISDGSLRKSYASLSVVRSQYSYVLNGSNVLRADLLRDDFECIAHLLFVRRALPIAKESAPILSRVAPPFFVIIRPDVTSSKEIPQSKGETFEKRKRLLAQHSQ
jgi:hypothetical protein